MMNLPNRKRNRLPDYNYNQEGAYFVTVCVKERKRLLSVISGENAEVILRPYGRIIEKYIRNVPEIEKYVIMPDHVHMIIRLGEEADQKREKTNNKVSGIVRSIKILTTKEIGESIFQRSYYDHVIRDQQDYNERWEYIEDNPRRWAEKKEGGK